MPDIKWPDDLKPVVLYERCLYDGQTIPPTTDPLRLCDDCLGIEPDGYHNHGTEAGGAWHKRHGTPPCGPCAAAVVEASRKRNGKPRTCLHCGETFTAASITRHTQRKHPGKARARA